MSTSDYTAAAIFQSQFPHTFNALQDLVMKMDKYYKVRNKTTFLGHDRGVKALQKFEESFSKYLYSLVLDNVASRESSSSDFHKHAVSMIYSFSTIFPNWQDGYAYAHEFFIENENDALLRIKQIMGLKNIYDEDPLIEEDNNSQYANLEDESDSQLDYEDFDNDDEDCDNTPAPTEEDEPEYESFIVNILDPRVESDEEKGNHSRFEQWTFEGEKSIDNIDQYVDPETCELYVHVKYVDDYPINIIIKKKLWYELEAMYDDAPIVKDDEFQINIFDEEEEDISFDCSEENNLEDDDEEIVSGESIKVHILDPRMEIEHMFDLDVEQQQGHYKDELWIIGRNVSQDSVDKFKDVVTGELYAVILYDDGVKNIKFTDRAQWLFMKQKLDDL